LFELGGPCAFARDIPDFGCGFAALCLCVRRMKIRNPQSEIRNFSLRTPASAVNSSFFVNFVRFVVPFLCVEGVLAQAKLF
jgi:hypothetical protein